MTVPISEVSEAIASFMPQFNDKIASLFAPSFRKAVRLTKSQVFVIMLLRKLPGQTATELGKSINMTNAGLTVLLDSLEARKIVQRLADGQDRRKTRLALTDKGVRAATALAREFDTALAARIAPLSDDERRMLVEQLYRLRHLLLKL
jgi:DNA-binding MarR family transcriptional regulator